MHWLPLQLEAITWYALSNIIASILINRFTEKPLRVLWIPNAVIVFVLACAYPFLMNPYTPWSLPFLGLGLVVSLTNILLYRALSDIDASLLNVTWLFLSVVLLFAGLIVFHDMLKITDIAGVLVIFVSILVLTAHHLKIGGKSRSLFYLFLSCLLYAPYYIVQKYALLHGTPMMTIWWWAQFGQALPIVLAPFIRPVWGRDIFSYFAKAPAAFFIFSGIKPFLFFAATLIEIRAYATGPLSLVAVVGNVQAFIVIALASLLHRLLPAYTPRETLDRGSLLRKGIGFILAFTGLAFLAMHQ